MRISRRRGSQFPRRGRGVSFSLLLDPVEDDIL